LLHIGTRAQVFPATNLRSIPTIRPALRSTTRSWVRYSFEAMLSARVFDRVREEERRKITCENTAQLSDFRPN
jgi:hypothetical protein